MKNMVYICSPFRGNGQVSEAENIRRARHYCEIVARLHPELMPIAPHLYFPQFMDDHDPDCRAYGLAKGIELLDLCDTIAVEGLGVMEPSEGMAREIEYAKSHGIKIVDIEYFTRPKAANAVASMAMSYAMNAIPKAWTRCSRSA